MSLRIETWSNVANDKESAAAVLVLVSFRESSSKPILLESPTRLLLVTCYYRFSFSGCSAFFWLVSCLVMSLWWYCIPSMMTSGWYIILFDVAIQELFRLLFCKIYSYGPYPFSHLFVRLCFLSIETFLVSLLYDFKMKEIAIKILFFALRELIFIVLNMQSSIL